MSPYDWKIIEWGEKPHANKQTKQTNKQQTFRGNSLVDIFWPLSKNIKMFKFRYKIIYNTILQVEQM